MGAQRAGARRARVRPRRAGRRARSPCSRRRRADRALLLRGEHGRARLPARLPRRDRAHAPGGRGARGARARQRLRRRLRRGRARAPSRTRACSRSSAATGKADNDSRLLREARGRYCLLLNEDSELHDGAARALLDALEADPGAAAAGAQLLTSEGEPTACAWRLPDIPWALAAAVFMHDRVAVQSTGDARARGGLGAVERDARAARGGASRSAGSTATSSSTPTRPTSASACTTPAGASCSCPARGRCTTTSSARTPPRCGAGSWSSTATATSTSASTGCTLTRLVWKAVLDLGLPRARRGRRGRCRGATRAATCCTPGRSCCPGRGEGIREAAEAHNRGLAQ